MKWTTEIGRFLRGTGMMVMLCLCGVGTPALAADRILLVGVGRYQNPSANLAGIDLDIDMLQREIVPLFEFQDSAIKVLRDEEATLANVERAIATWLVEGVGLDDRVLFYFSGHGTRIPDENGDEEDGADEVLVMHDVKVTERQGKPTLDNVLVDDRVAELLDRIPSRNILVLVDACHSGTPTKSFKTEPSFLGQEEGYFKFFYYKGMPLASKGNFGVRETKKGDDRYVSIGAARDDEVSIATKQGSLFTLGLRETIRQFAQAQRPLTPKELAEQASVFIQQRTQSARPPQSPFHPQVTGNPELANKPLRMRALTGGQGPQWRQIEEVVGRGKPLRVALNQETYGLGDLLAISIEIPEAGYLNVVNVGPDDQATVLFPNKYHADNRINPGQIKIPTEQMRFDLPAQEPKGPSLVAAFLTQEPVNLHQSSFGARDSKGNLAEVFGTLSPLGLRSFGVRERPASESSPGPATSLSAGKIETVVCDKQPCR